MSSDYYTEILEPRYREHERKNGNHEMSDNLESVASHHGPTQVTLHAAASPHKRRSGLFTEGATSLHASNLITFPPLFPPNMSSTQSAVVVAIETISFRLNI